MGVVSTEKVDWLYYTPFVPQSVPPTQSVPPMLLLVDFSPPLALLQNRRLEVCLAGGQDILHNRIRLFAG